MASSESDDSIDIRKVRRSHPRDHPAPQADSPGVSKSGFLKRKGTWRGTWREYFYVVDTGCLVEYSKPGSSRPKKFYSLSHFAVKLASKLTGVENTFGLFSMTVARQPVYFLCPDEPSLTSWVSMLSKFANQATDLDFDEDSKLLEAFNDGVIVASTDGTIVGANTAFADMFGYQRTELLGRNVTDLMESQYAVHHSAYMRKYLEEGHGTFIGQARQYNVRDATGRFVPAEISLGEMIRGSQKNFIGRFRLVQPGVSTAKAHMRRESSSSSITDDESIDQSAYSSISTIVRGVLAASEEQIAAAVYSELKSVKALLEVERKKTAKQTRTIRKLKALRVQAKTAGAQPSSASQVAVTDSTASQSPQRGDRDGLLFVDPSEPVIGQRLASTGGSGAGVYCANVDGWQCVVKELVTKDLPVQQLRLFEFEMDTLEHLPLHRNLARYLFHVKTPTKYQLFMTRYDETLGHIIRNRAKEAKPFTKHEVVKFMIDITRGLDVLHKHEIIHRDIKADNIFVEFGRSGDVERLVIGDFDAAKRIALHGQAQTVIGTPGYMAPEIMTDTRYGYPADIWSVGMVLHELLTLERPFERNPMGAMTILMSRTSPTIDSALVAPHLTPYIPIFDKCVSFDPLTRPTCLELNRLFIDEFLLCG